MIKREYYVKAFMRGNHNQYAGGQRSAGSDH